jgi:hypothetical protein
MQQQLQELQESFQLLPAAMRRVYLRRIKADAKAVAKPSTLRLAAVDGRLVGADELGVEVLRKSQQG